MVLMYYGGMWDSMFVMIIPQSMLDGANNYPLMAIPFFVFAGEIMTEGGLSKRVVKLAQLIIGRVRGGLGGGVRPAGAARHERIRLGAGAVVDRDVVAGVHDVPGDGRPHDAGADEGDLQLLVCHV